MSEYEWFEPPDPPEGWEGASYWPRHCLNHAHVTCGGHDLIGGRCDTYEEAAEKCRRLNNGEGTDDVLGGSVMSRMLDELPGTFPDKAQDGEDD